MSISSFLFGSSGKTKVVSNAPTINATQSPYLTAGWDAAKSEFQNKLGSPAYQGPTYAGLNGMQTAGANTLATYGANQGAQMGSAVDAAAIKNINAGSMFGSNAQNVYNQSQVDPTGKIIAQAQQYANNPAVDGMIDANTRDIKRTLGESTLPGIQSSFSDAGALNSSRAGAMEAVATRGAADQVGDISSNIRGTMFNNGLNLAQTQHNANLTNQMASNSQIGTAFDSGTKGATLGQGINFGNAQAMSEAGGVYQQDQQGQYDDSYAKWQADDTRRQEMINQYLASINGGQAIAGGSATPITTGAKPSALATAGGLAAAAYGMFG